MILHGVFFGHDHVKMARLLLFPFAIALSPLRRTELHSCVLGLAHRTPHICQVCVLVIP